MAGIRFNTYQVPNWIVPERLFTDVFPQTLERNEGETVTQSSGDGFTNPTRIVFRGKNRFANTIDRDQFLAELEFRAQSATYVRFADLVDIPVNEGWVEINLTGSRVDVELEVIFLPTTPEYLWLFVDGFFWNNNTILFTDMTRRFDEVRL